MSSGLPFSTTALSYRPPTIPPDLTRSALCIPHSGLHGPNSLLARHAELRIASTPEKRYSPLMTITLPSALSALVREKVASGLYANESEVVCEALRHEFGREAVNLWVREQATAGFAQLDAGEFEELTREELIARLSRRRAA